MSDATLTVVLDRLLPANGELGAAGSLGLAPSLRSDPLLDSMPDAIDRVLGHLPDDFLELPPEQQVTAIRAAEEEDGEAFAILINLAYNAYYIDPRVLTHLSKQTGYNSGAPQPAGYDIEPFDEEILSTIRQREPLWRKVDP